MKEGIGTSSPNISAPFFIRDKKAVSNSGSCTADGEAILCRITGALLEKNVLPEHAGLQDLDQMDVLHVGGTHATIELIELLKPNPNAKVLDVGSGLGGPARWLVNATGCRVTGIDINKAYCEVGAEINRWLGFSDQIEFMHGDATNLDRFAGSTFDAAWAVHTSMMIRDKSGLYRGIANVIKPGGRLVLYDPILGLEGFSFYPVPWAERRSASQLVDLKEMVRSLTEAGFELESVQDKTLEGLAHLTVEIVRRLQTVIHEPDPYYVLGESGLIQLVNVAKGLAENQLSLVYLVCHRLP